MLFGGDNSKRSLRSRVIQCGEKAESRCDATFMQRQVTRPPILPGSDDVADRLYRHKKIMETYTYITAYALISWRRRFYACYLRLSETEAYVGESRPCG
jgi:hypothetical protein